MSEETERFTIVENNLLSNIKRQSNIPFGPKVHTNHSREERGRSTKVPERNLPVRVGDPGGG